MEIVEGVVQAATANIRAVYHKMDDMVLSGSQFEHQFTAAIQSAWAEVESAIIEATLPANPLSPISEGTLGDGMIGTWSLQTAQSLGRPSSLTCGPPAHHRAGLGRCDLAPAEKRSRMRIWRGGPEMSSVYSLSDGDRAKI